MPKLVILVFGILCHHLGQTLEDQIAIETASSYSSSYPHSISILPAPAEIKAQYAPSANEDEIEELPKPMAKRDVSWEFKVDSRLISQLLTQPFIFAAN